MTRPAAATANANQGTAVEDIVVTAQLRSQSLQKVPAAVTALDDDALVNRGALQLSQVSQLVPALRIPSLRSQTFINLRGVGQQVSGPNADPQVAVNVNGVYMPSEITNMTFFDVERLEVVPGPQGTLYGRNSTGGVLNMFTRRPGDEPSANGYAEVGNYSRVSGLVAADIPLTDTLAIRAAATLTRHSGYYTNGMDAQETYGGRLTVVWRPDDATTITGIGTYVHEGGLPTAAQLFPLRYGNVRRIDYDPGSFGAQNDISAKTVSLEVNRELGSGLLLTYLGGYNRLDGYVVTSLYPVPSGSTDTTFPVYTDLANKSTSHELRLNGTWDRLQTVLGAYYFWNDSLNGSLVTTQTGTFMTAKSHGAAVFGQATFSVLDALRLTGGLRYSTTEKSLTGVTLRPPNRTVSLPFVGPGKTENRVDWRAGVEFDIAPRSMLYVNVQTGFTPGGYSNATVTLASTQAVEFDQTTLLAYSAGMKNRLFDDMLTLNVEGFYYDYKDYQVSARNFVTLQANVYNAQKAEIYGAQIDGQLKFGPNDRLSLGMVYVKPKLTRLVLPGGATAPGPGGLQISDLSGFDLPYAPRWTVNASYQHIFPLASGGQVEALVSTQYASGQWLIYSHPDTTRIKGDIRTDATLTYRPENERWAISAWVRNLENSVVRVFGGSLTSPQAFSNLDAPRTFGGRISFDF